MLRVRVPPEKMHERVTHSSQNESQEQTARRCQEPELKAEKKKTELERSFSTPKPQFLIKHSMIQSH